MLELYQKEECPYCAKVRQYLSDNCIDWVARSTPKHCRTTREKMFALAGEDAKEQVPFLHDPKTGVAMYESDAIIEYIRKTYVEKE